MLFKNLYLDKTAHCEAWLIIYNIQLIISDSLICAANVGKSGAISTLLILESQTNILID